MYALSDGSHTNEADNDISDGVRQPLQYSIEFIHRYVKYRQ